MQTSRLFPASCLLVLILAVLGAAPAPPHPAGKGFTAEDFEKEAPGPGLLATISEDENTNNTCPGQTIACDDLVNAHIEPAGDQDLYNVTVDAGACLTVGTDADTVTDTVIEILNEDCSVVLAMDDDNGPGPFSLISDFRVPAAGTYVVRVRHYLSGGRGKYELFVKCKAGGEPNANCETADTLTCGVINLGGTTDCTGNDYNAQGAAGSCTQFSSNGQDVVYLVRAEEGTSISLEYLSTADASLYIVTNCASPADSCVAGVDAKRTGELETLQYTFTKTDDYYIILDSFGTNTSGDWSLKGMLECPTPVTPVTWGQIKSRYTFRETGH